MTFKGHARSSQMSRFDSEYDFLLFRSNGGPILYSFPHIAKYWSKIAKFKYPTCIQHHRKGDPVIISQRCLVSGK